MIRLENNRKINPLAMLLLFSSIALLAQVSNADVRIDRFDQVDRSEFDRTFYENQRSIAVPVLTRRAMQLDQPGPRNHINYLQKRRMPYGRELADRMRGSLTIPPGYEIESIMPLERGHGGERLVPVAIQSMPLRRPGWSLRGHNQQRQDQMDQEAPAEDHEQPAPAADQMIMMQVPPTHSPSGTTTEGEGPADGDGYQEDNQPPTAMISTMEDHIQPITMDIPAQPLTHGLSQLDAAIERLQLQSHEVHGPSIPVITISGYPREVIYERNYAMPTPDASAVPQVTRTAIDDHEELSDRQKRYLRTVLTNYFKMIKKIQHEKPAKDSSQPLTNGEETSTEAVGGAGGDSGEDYRTSGTRAFLGPAQSFWTPIVAKDQQEPGMYYI